MKADNPSIIYQQKTASILLVANRNCRKAKMHSEANISKCLWQNYLSMNCSKMVPLIVLFISSRYG